MPVVIALAVVGVDGDGFAVFEVSLTVGVVADAEVGTVLLCFAMFECMNNGVGVGRFGGHCKSLVC